MKKAFLSLSVLVLALVFVKCGPAAEDRFKMHETAKHVSDSIGKAIDIELAKGAIPGTAAPTATISADTTKH